jgi:hypothetical protein
MTRQGIVLLVLALVLGTGAAPATAVMAPSGIDPRLRLDWETGQARGGGQAITGYIYNDYARVAIDVRILVESLDASGQVIGRATGFVLGIVPVFNRSYFYVPLKTPGTGYRVTVSTFQWRDGG